MTHNYIKRASLLLPKAITAAGFIALLVTRPALATVSTKRVVTAIRDEVCFETFWWNKHDFRLGEKASVVATKKGKDTYVWSNDLVVLPRGQKWVNFFTIFSAPKQTVVTSSSGYNPTVVANTRPTKTRPDFVSEKTGQSIQLVLPSDCTPHFAPKTQLKERMLRVIKASIKAELTLFSKHASSEYPAHLKIMIANFNTSYPETQVWVPATGELFHVIFRSIADPLGLDYLKEDSYPIRPEYSRAAIEAVKEKIAKYAIVYEVTLATSEKALTVQ